jgi:peptidoglycan hydrolase-like protein with peptidoglycan-binding domain
MSMAVEVKLSLPVLRESPEFSGTVRRMQQMVNVFTGVAEEGGTALPVTDDGVFGPRTKAAVKVFQLQQHLDQDGVVGPKTWTALLNEWLSGREPG